MTTPLPFVSVIVVNYNGGPFLEGCLSSLSRIEYPKSSYEVIMVDNGSSDRSVECVEKNFPWAKVLPLGWNHGYAGGNNRGVEIGRGDFIVFLNSDTVVERRWLKELVKPLLVDERAAICGSKILLMDPPNHIQYAGGFLNLVGGPLYYPFHERGAEQEFYFVGSVCGASFLMRKTVYKALGGFDESFFMYSDESDLCLRTWICGYHVVYAPRSIVHHFGGGNQQRRVHSHSDSILGARLTSSLTLYHGNKNSIASLIKNFELKDLLEGIILSLLYGALQLILTLRGGDPAEPKLLAKGYLWPIRNLKEVWRKRLIIQNTRKIADLELKRIGVLLSAAKMIKLITSKIA